VAVAGAEVNGPVQQHKVWDLSCVLRQPTTAGDVYLKETVDSPLFVSEAAVIPLLADLFPRHVPTPLAVDPERGWIATADFGAELGWEASVPARQEALRQYAELQHESVRHVDALLAAGCLDRRPSWLGAQLRHWLGGEATRHWASPVLAQQLAAAVPRLVELCAELAGSSLPDTLLHGDMHMANVARRPGGGYLFFDWTDAGVGHPFVDMIAVAHEQDEKDRAVLRETYLEQWAGATDRARLDRDWAVSEVLAHANQAISYMSLGLSLRDTGTTSPHSLFGSYTAKWLRDLLGVLDRLDGPEPAIPAT
jgi:Phosphotransferase enzyme family